MRKIAALYRLMEIRFMNQYGKNAAWNIHVLNHREEIVQMEWARLFPTKGDDGGILPHPAEEDIEVGVLLIKEAHPTWF